MQSLPPHTDLTGCVYAGYSFTFIVNFSYPFRRIKMYFSLSRLVIFFYPHWIFEATVLNQLKNNTVFPKIFSMCLAGSLAALSHLIIAPALEEVSVINPSAQVKNKLGEVEWLAHGHTVTAARVDAES